MAKTLRIRLAINGCCRWAAEPGEFQYHLGWRHRHPVLCASRFFVFEIVCCSNYRKHYNCSIIWQNIIVGKTKRKRKIEVNHFYTNVNTGRIFDITDKANGEVLHLTDKVRCSFCNLSNSNGFELSRMIFNLQTAGCDDDGVSSGQPLPHGDALVLAKGRQPVLFCSILFRMDKL